LDFNLNIVFYLIGYLVGAIPFGVILAKTMAGADIRQSGSKSIGATNVLRVLKEKDPKLAKKIAALTLILDAVKPIVVMVAAMLFGLGAAELWMIGVLAVLGHCFSPYLKFEGGKGVATGVGVFAFMLPLVTVLTLVIYVVAAKTIKISSLSSLIGLAGFVALSYILYPQIPEIDSHAPIWLISFLVFYKHIPNIVRLIKGEEKRVV
jgi:glycerol-3-phosphate acyltransferase PlsY